MVLLAQSQRSNTCFDHVEQKPEKMCIFCFIQGWLLIHFQFIFMQANHSLNSSYLCDTVSTENQFFRVYIGKISFSSWKRKAVHSFFKWKEKGKVIITVSFRVLNLFWQIQRNGALDSSILTPVSWDWRGKMPSGNSWFGKPSWVCW